MPNAKNAVVPLLDEGVNEASATEDSAGLPLNSKGTSEGPTPTRSLPYTSSNEQPKINSAIKSAPTIPIPQPPLRKRARIIGCCQRKDATKKQLSR